MLTGHIDLDLSEADPTRSTGEGELVFRDLRLEGGRFSGLEINQKGRFDKAELRFTVADGKARVEQGVIEGDVLHAKLEGEITLSKKLSRSRLRIPVVFTVSEELDKLLALVPGAKDAKDEDGAWHYLLSGTVEHPRFKPDRVRRGGVASPARGPRVPGDVEPPLRGGGPALLDREDAGGPERPDAGKMSPEERRKLREERMRERRERMRARREGGDGALTPDERRARRLPPDNDDELDDLPGEPEYPRVQNFEPPRPPEDREFRQSPPDDDEPLPPPKGQYYEEFEQ
jgi:hypothetical protein